MLKLEIHIGTENINISGALVSHYTFVFCAFVFLFLSRSSLWSAISSDLDTVLIFKRTRRDEYVDDILCHDIYFLISADTCNMYFKDTHSQTRPKRNILHYLLCVSCFLS